MAKEKKITFWNIWDSIQGDKVIWMVTILLILLSIICIFSSTTLLATPDKTRMDIFWEQMGIVLLGSGLIFACYFLPNRWPKIFLQLSQLGFAVSLFNLLMLFGPLAIEVNGARRAWRLGPLTVQSYEIVKVSMVMYLSWAVYSYKNGGFKLAKRLSKRFKSLGFLAKEGWQRIIYIHLPILIVCALTLPGSFSSTAFVAGIMFATILIGGISFKDVFKVCCLVVALFAIMFGIYKLTDNTLGRDIVKKVPILNRFPTIEARFSRFTQDNEDLEELKKTNYKAFMERIDDMRQPEGAKIAIHEGGLIGKWISGNSTQKYAVPLIFSDFMYSFIIEEYGLLIGILVMILYVSLLARGSIIVRNCDNDFAKTTVAGLTLLISGQAMMHMYINAGLWPLTGQTLPMISHGKTSFLAFSIAFGVLLAISKMAKKNVEMEAEIAGPLVVQSEDEIQDGLNDLDALDSMD